jgi:hypothetical protein
LIERIEPDALVAAENIGVLGYETCLRILDLLGLLDPTIARTGGVRGPFGASGGKMIG